MNTVPAMADLSGPIAGGTHGWPFAAYLDDLRALGYVEEEYFLHGAATSYEPQGPLNIDGKWSVVRRLAAPYATRILVQRPEDPHRFNGKVIVEWANVSSGYDVLVHNLEGLLEQGFAYAAVSAQYLSVHGHDKNSKGLSVWDPVRYGSLHHPGDSFSYDIFSQAGRALGPNRSQGAIDPLRGLKVESLIAVGASQSSWRLATYANAVQPLDRVFDAIMPTFWRGVASGFDDGVLDMYQIGLLAAQEGHRARGRASRIRDDLGIPVMVVNSEGETLFHAPVRQPDSDKFRFWEVAGASHFPLSMLEPLTRYFQRDFGMPFPAFAVPANQSHVSWEAVLESAIVGMAGWLDSPHAPMQIASIHLRGQPPAIARDEFGIARGGVRLPDVEVPTAVNDGSANGLMGSYAPLDPETLRSLYPDHDAYVDLVSRAAASAQSLGVIPARVAQHYVAAARAARFLPDP